MSKVDTMGAGDTLRKKMPLHKFTQCSHGMTFPLNVQMQPTNKLYISR